MTVNIKINTDTPTGRRLLREVSKYPKVVEIENSESKVIKSVPRETISENEVFEKVWDIMSDHYHVDIRKV